MATVSRKASSAPISSKSSARSGSLSHRSRPPSPPCMFVIDPWSVPAPKAPKPLPKLEKKPKRPSTSPSQSIFPSFGKKKSFSHKGKSKESVIVEPTSASTESWSDTGSIPPPASSSTSLTSFNSSSRSIPSSPKKQTANVTERLLETLAPPSATSPALDTDARQHRRVLPSSSTHTIGAGSTPSFRRHLKHRSSASDLSHQSQGSRKKELSFLHRRASVNFLHRAVSTSSKETYQSGATSVTPSSASPAPVHHHRIPSSALNFESSSESGDRASQLSIDRFDVHHHTSSSSSGSGQPHDPYSYSGPLHPVRYSPSQESLMLEAVEAPMTFAAGPSTSPTPYSHIPSSYSPTPPASSPTESPPAIMSSPPRSRSASTSHQFDTVHQAAEMTPFSTNGKSAATLSPSTVVHHDSPGAHRGHKTSHSIAMRPTSPFDNLIPPIHSIIPNKVKVVPLAPTQKQNPRQHQNLESSQNFLGFSRQASGTTRQHSQQGWMGEWNRNDMSDVIQSLRNLK